MATKTTASKPASKASTSRKAAPKPAKVALEPVVVEEAEVAAKVVASMRVKDLIERVSAAADQNKKDVRAIVEATLAELGKALEAGESLNLPPFGKIRIANQKGDASGQMMTLKLRRGGERKPGKNAGKEALAEVGEDS